jgi:hypothetical protein
MNYKQVLVPMWVAQIALVAASIVFTFLSTNRGRFVDSAGYWLMLAGWIVMLAMGMLASVAFGKALAAEHDGHEKAGSYFVAGVIAASVGVFAMLLPMLVRILANAMIFSGSAGH